MSHPIPATQYELKALIKLVGKLEKRIYKLEATDLSNPTEPVKSPPEELELEAILEEHFIYQDNAQERMEIKQAKAQIQALIHQATIKELERLQSHLNLISYSETDEALRENHKQERAIEERINELKEIV